MKCVEMSLAMLVSLAILECRVATPVEENLAIVPAEGGQDLQEEVIQENVYDKKQCHAKPDGLLDDRDMTLVDLARKLDTLTPNLTETEKDLLDEMLESDGCTEDQVRSAMERYNNGEAEETGNHRAKRSDCQISCPKGDGVATNCSRRCKCRCDWFGKPKCKCCGWLGC